MSGIDQRNPTSPSVRVRSNRVMQAPHSPSETKESAQLEGLSTQNATPVQASSPVSSSQASSRVLKSSLRHSGFKTEVDGERNAGHVVFDMEDVGETSSYRERLEGSSRESIAASMSLLGIPQPRKESDGLSGLKNTFIRRQLWTMLQPTDNRLSMKLFGSKRGLQKEKKRLKQAGFLIIHPCSTFKFYWDLLMVLLLIANLLSLPVIIAFFYASELSQTWTIFNCSSDSLFILDVIINMRSGYMDLSTAEQVILDPKKIAIHYLKTWFCIDFVSSIPMDCIFLWVGGGENKLYEVSKALRILRLAKLLSLVRLLRLSRLMRFVRQWEQVFNVAGAVIRIVNLVGFMLLISHWNGCLQFLVPMLQQFPQDSWVSINNLQNAHWWDQYTWSLFKAMSHMLCIGYGRFPPQSITDLWLTMASMICGASCFALFIGHATNLIQAMDSSCRQYREKLKQVEEYMAYRRLPSEMRDRITDYYDYRYHGKMFNEVAIFSEVSAKLHQDIANYNCRDLVASVPFFTNADTNFVTRVVSLLKFELFQPGDCIINEGTFGDRMFFIQQGIVDIITSEGDIATTLSDGSYFGEICLLTQERRVATVRTEAYCSLYSLGVVHFHQVLDEFPAMRKTMQEVALRRLHKIGRTSKVLVAALKQHKATSSNSNESNLLFELPPDSMSSSVTGEPGLYRRTSEDEFGDSEEQILQINEGPSQGSVLRPTDGQYCPIDEAMPPQ